MPVLENDVYQDGSVVRRETIDLDADTYTLEEAPTPGEPLVVTEGPRPLTAEERLIYDPPKTREQREASALRISARMATRAPLAAEDVFTASEIEDLAAVFPAWEVGVSYEVGDVVAFDAGDGPRLWEVRQAHTSQADWIPPQVLALFYRFRAVNDPAETPAWEASTPYTVDDEVTYEGTTYRCLQAHTSQLGWEPPNVPSLWTAS